MACLLYTSLPAKHSNVGHSHPNTIALEEVERIFVGMGYEVVEGPEVEYDLYNFEKLNIPKNHPARDEQDTFYVNDSIVLRSQTSPVQVRTMEQGLSLIHILVGAMVMAFSIDVKAAMIFVVVIPVLSVVVFGIMLISIDVYKRQDLQSQYPDPL